MALDRTHPLIRKRTADANPAPDHVHRRDWEQVWSLVLTGLAGLLCLALLSYRAHSLPAWFPWDSQATGQAAGSNLLGPLGAVAAWGLFHLFGLAAFWLPVALLWAAVAIFFQFPIFRWRTLGALIVFLVASACQVQWQSLLLEGWVDRLQLPGKGGLAGLVVGAGLLQNTVGSVGGTVMALCAQVVGLIFVVGVHPFELKAYVKRKMAERNLPPAGLEPSTIHPGPIAYYCNVPEHRCLEHHPVRRDGFRHSETPEEKRPPAGVVQAEVIPAEEADESEEFEDLTFIEATAVEPEVVAATPVPPPRAAPSEGREKAAPTLAEILRAREAAVRPPASSCVEPRGVSTPPARVPFGATGLHFGAFVPPGIELLGGEKDDAAPLTDRAEMAETHAIIVDTLKTFGLDVSPGEVTCGPTITRYEIYPSPGLRVKQITALEADLALATKAKTINILAPIPGKDTVGVEIENARKSIVPLRALLEAAEFRQPGKRIPIALGQDVYGETILADLAAMPHLLVAGATGSGKSVCLNCIIASLLFRFKPDELRLVMIDPKVVEMQVYHSLPHLALPVVTDPKRVPIALHWVIDEMERRYQLFAEYGVRKLDEYNKRDRNKPPRPYRLGRGEQMQFDYDQENVLLSDPDQEREGFAGRQTSAEKESASRDPERLPYIVVIIDELADLMQTAPADVESAINRLCQKARAAGIHLIVATQSPRVDVVTGLIKANIPARIAFQVASNADSRVILDKSGAEKLVGKGDMLYQPPDSAIMIRAQGAFVADEEVRDIVEHCSSQALPVFDPSIEDLMYGEAGYGEEGEVLSQADEETLQRCIEAIRMDRKASASYLQRRLRIGYVRAARMMDLLEERGLVGPADGAKPREIYLQADLGD